MTQVAQWGEDDVAEFRPLLVECCERLEYGQWFALFHPVLQNAPAVWVARMRAKWRVGLSLPRDDFEMPTPVGAVLVSHYWLPPSKTVSTWRCDSATTVGAAWATTVACSALFPATLPDRFDYTAGTTLRGGPMPDTGRLSEFLSRSE